jgi:hypothetical protein
MGGSMNDAQTWTLIAGFLAILSTMVAMTLRITRVEIGAVRSDLGGRIDVLDERLSGVEERLGDKIDHLDRDIQTVITRLMDR